MHAVAVDDNRLLRSIPTARVALIDRIARSAGAARRSDLTSRFLRSYFHGVGEEDLAARAPRDLAKAALAHLAFGSRRARGSSLVKVFNPTLAADGFESAHTLVLTVTEDMPFLVDSLGMAVGRAELAVHLIVHPVLQVRRDRNGRLLDLGANGAAAAQAESWQLYEIDRIADPRQLERLQADLADTLADVRIAVRDWRAMRERARDVIGELGAHPPPLPPAEVSEASHLLDWMEQRHFVFLGYRRYRLERGRSADRLVPERASGLGILSPARRRGERHRVTELRGDVRTRAREPELLIITKANSIATVHRGEFLDYVGVKTFDGRGQVDGEHRFLGLWTSTAYHGSPRDIPVLRHKVDRVIEHFGLDPASHDGKAVLNVLETYPRDELFQARVTDLIRIVRGVVNLYERRTVRLLVRRDPYHRFYSCLVFVPRDRYNTEVRQRIEQIAREGFSGGKVESNVQMSGSNHARVHVVVHTDPRERQHPDFALIERRIAEAALTWSDRLSEVLTAQRGEARGRALAGRYRRAFPLAYEENVSPQEALADLDELEALREQPGALRLALYRPPGQILQRVHLKIVKLGDPVPISDVLPMLENFGLRVISERPYELHWPEGGRAWIQDFELEQRERQAVDIAPIEGIFREAFAAAWSGAVENDGFNRLLIAAGLNARQVVVLRACCRYLLQAGVPFSQSSMERALANNGTIARQLVRLFETRFDPGPGSAGRVRRAATLSAQIRTALDGVGSLDDDRILRAYLGLLQAMVRTNFYQTDAQGAPKPYLSVKLDPAKIAELPLPKPKFEIFVYSPRVEGVHLRMGEVARGGIRWSDRRDDFRTEILGLMKAQNVKNTLIVPVGAKGGFVAKRLPVSGSRDEVQAEVVACYQTFIRGLLDLTDNIVGSRIVPPPQLVREDGDDPYLVVAADKGTATFSDIANAISGEYRFWLGDAFASGGSAGYDHKKMGITARGAWECVKRHFRELGVDIQKTDFTVAGIGDMSGDVFGNGMLLSRHICLQAAFDHRHIFLDPQPDAAASFAERARLFALPRSSWDDYDRRKISRGGGVFPRAAKSVPLSAEARALLGLEGGSAAPNEVLRAILRLPVDLLWNGGIGTYVKATEERNIEVGDRANDALRVNGRELRAKVVGEGGNLGLTQRGRIEYAFAGGRLNTDFIDNSAGVNTSDVEVNIKILLNPLVHEGRLTRRDRDRLLASMTREVGALVLRNNYLQSQAISTLELQSIARLPEFQHLIRSLERSGDLNRGLEYLPSDDELSERRKAGIGLSRPELAIVLAYSKIWLNTHLLASNVPEDPYLSSELERYFPRPVQARFTRAITRHRLRREIIATATTNSLVNRMGPTFVTRAQEDTGAEPAQVARAYTAAREIFAMRAVWEHIESLDTRVKATVQYEAMFQTSRLLRHATYWLLGARIKLQVADAVAEFRAGVERLEADIQQVLTGAELARFEEGRQRFEKAGLPVTLAARIASLEALNAALDIVEIAAAHRVSVIETARVYFEVGTRIGFDWLRTRIEKLTVEGPWQAIARTGLRDAALRVQRRLSERVLARGGRGTAAARVDAWVDSAGKDLAHWQRTLTDMRAAGASDFATLTVGVEAVRKLAN
ncbi:MAG: NAD-glutamate dehydrogenase [Gammaproteobacteria bacterium]|nr:NAD-glutamate dehydrogenase [Gammaproteobacteria bacterium]MBV9696023.1 NAD-glutamate dehydrogenase [Gammaproteobacteria bacterium]